MTINPVISTAANLFKIMVVTIFLSALTQACSPARSSRAPNATTTPTGDPAARIINRDISGDDADFPAAVPQTRGLDKSSIGKTYRDTVMINGFKVPLPEGDWAVLANLSSEYKLVSATGEILFLGRIENKSLAGAIIVHAYRGRETPGYGFPAYTHCDDSENLYAFKEAGKPFGHQSCWTVSARFTKPWLSWADSRVRLTDIVRAAAAGMEAKGVGFPQDFPRVWYSLAEKWGSLEVQYFFNPEIEGISSQTVTSARDSDWRLAHIQDYPEKLAYRDKLKSWGEGIWPKVQAAFNAGAVQNGPDLVIADHRQGETEASFNFNNNPHPEYPAIARERKWQGKVMLRVEVDAKGWVESIQIYKSSGHQILDEAALAAVKKWRFIPARKAENPIALSILVPITFKLEGATPTSPNSGLPPPRLSNTPLISPIQNRFSSE